MPNTYQQGRVGKVHVAQESPYGTAGAFSGTTALRHLNVRLNYSPRNRVDSPERMATHPSQNTRLTRRTTGSFVLGSMFFPSGVLNTLPEFNLPIKNAMGAVTNTTAATTVSAAPSPTVTGCTVASATGLVVGQPILINSSGGPYVRWITNIATNAITWAPALPAAPTTGNAVKGCIGYSLATAPFGSLNIGHYLTSVSKEGIGCAADVLKLDFDANSEVMWEVSGPMKTRNPTAQADPGTFTTVGASTLPPSGLTGSIAYGPSATATAEEILKASFTITNGFTLDNVAYGTSAAQALNRVGKRKVELSFDAMYSNDVSFMDAAEQLQQNAMVIQCGLTEGSIIAVYCPKIELEVPDDPNEEGTMQHSFKGVALGSSGNDELMIAVA